MNKQRDLLGKTLIIGIFILLICTSIIPIDGAYATASTIKEDNGSLLGYVNDTSGNPIEGALVRVYFHDTYEEDYSDSAGFYHVTTIHICYCMKNTSCSKDGYKTEWVLLCIDENTTFDFVLTTGNNPPTKPEVEGPGSGKSGMEICFTFRTTDSEEDEVKYYIDWGDGNITETNYAPSNTPVGVCHTWYEKGCYIFRCRATDIHGAESEWFEHEFWVDKSRASYMPIYQLLCERFPLLEVFLRIMNI